MSTTFEDDGYTVADVQSMMSINLHPKILLIFCHGIYTCIFSIALYYIAQSAQPRRKRITLASIVTFLWATNTIIVALNWKYFDDQFITHGVSLADEFNFYLYDLILIWRCWVLYSGSLVVVAIPSLCLVTETISACIVMIVYFNGPLVGANQVNWSLVYYSITLVTNTLCTFLILFRIVRVSSVGVSLKTYRGIIEILVESAAMYAIIYMALLVSYAYEFYCTPPENPMPISSYLVLVSYSITGIAPTLIILRVMTGHSRPDDSWTRPSLPHLRTPMRSLAESLQFASAPSHSIGTEQTGADNDVEQGREPNVERDEEAEASGSASHIERTADLEDKSTEVKVETRDQ